MERMVLTSVNIFNALLCSSSIQTMLTYYALDNYLFVHYGCAIYSAYAQIEALCVENKIFSFALQFLTADKLFALANIRASTAEEKQRTAEFW